MIIVTKNIPTKSLILKVAERMFAEKGFKEIRISDISSEVGIKESTIYEHYKNKQDILQHLPIEKTNELIKINSHNIRGLVDSEIKLRKLIWNYVEYLVDNLYYTRLLIFNLRANKRFHSVNRALIHDFIEPYKATIIEGQQSENFRNDITPFLILKLIFGTIDLLMIDWILKNKNPLDFFESFFILIINAIKFRSIVPSTNNKREKILFAAEKLFFEKGFDKTRIQDISGLADIADGTIYQYFRSKEEILFSLPAEKTKKLIAIQKEHLKGIKNTEQKLIVMITDYLRFLDLNREYSSLVLFDLRYNRKFYESDAYNYFRKFASTFYDIILEGINLNCFEDDVNPHLVVQMIFGIIDHSLLTCLLFENPGSMVSLCEPICNLILSAIKKNSQNTSGKAGGLNL